MSTDVDVRCSCGEFTAVARGVSRETGNRCVCYCDDCQTYAHFLGGVHMTLDPNGGTDVFQMSPARLEFTRGAERLACVRLTENGLYRWYTSCCNTPITNNFSSRQVPFAGMLSNSFVPADGRSLDDVLGPVRARVNGRFAKGDLSQLKAHDRAPIAMLLRVFSMLVMARLRGEHKRSPLFDAKSRAPIATPHVLSDEELKKAVSARDAR